MKIMTLFGEVDATKKCNTCSKVLPVEDFYLESSTKSKHNEQRREQCKHCWKLHNGRSNFSNVVSFEVKK